MSVTVDVEELRVGMFVHLDLGWWAHPFALSSFLVSSTEQIDTIRGLGLKKVRWSPEKSRLDDEPRVPMTDAVKEAAVPTTAEGGDTGASAGRAELSTPGDPRACLRAALAEQHAAQQCCERQYLEAGSAWCEARRQVQHAPMQALRITEGLTRSLLDKMMVDREMCVRVISDLGGDRVAGHALNVAVISLLMGRVFGFSEDDMLDLGVGALLHDVGKLDLPDRVQHGDAQLGHHETLAYREHVALGLAHGGRMGLREGAMQVLAQHHEMADGSGFPARLNLDRMDIGARIVALVNRYDNLCNPPQAATALTPHEALSMIFAQSRTKFDATMLNAFIRMMGVYPPGSLVQLTDDRYASVVSCNSSRPLKPRVLVCDAAVPADEALLLNLDGLADIGIRRSLKPGHLPPAVRDYLSPRLRMVYFFEPVNAPVTVMEALAA